MRSMTRIEVAVTLLALYVWRWLEALQDFAAAVNESRRSQRRGASDPEWQRMLRRMAAPVREARLKTPTGELPRMGLYKALGETAPTQPLPLAVQAGATGIADIAPLYVAPVPVVTEEGTVVDVEPKSGKRNHRRLVPAGPVKPRRRVRTDAKRAVMAGVAEVRAAEARVRQQLDRVVLEAMQAAGLTLQEARDIIGAHHYESVFDRMGVA